MLKFEHEITPKSVIKNHRNKRRTYWCAPRRVKSTVIVGNFDNSLTQKKNIKKRHHKKKRKTMKSLRRIDILAQPKSIKHKVEHKNHFSTVSKSAQRYQIPKRSISSDQKSTIYQHKTFRIKKFKGTRELPMNSTLKDCSTIILPKKLGVRLFALVKKKLKELANSNNT
ncbi:uncharacterized protein LOC117235309 [Bombus vosnesenskii]|uniref:Uncharacterized protein LOC117235309 n=1 Tax=Bombus vosnesenskii TaxID=207650 RepID=A0A6J3KIV2_9HYME|nr:uncharacterized protein LOC117235309 [Bombus vosnesenskii]